MKYNPFSLEGKVVLVTGASSGIGESTAIECANLGAKLIITGRNRERLFNTLNKLDGDGHKFVIADLTTNEGKESVLNEIDILDGLVLCAGQTDIVPFLLANRKRFDSIFEINYFSQVELLRLILKNKKLHEKASVVFVSSIAGNCTTTKGNTIYGASKAALNSTMKFCALELAPKMIRCNAVLPGNVTTKMIMGGG